MDVDTDDLVGFTDTDSGNGVPANPCYWFCTWISNEDVNILIC